MHGILCSASLSRWATSTHT